MNVQELIDELSTYPRNIEVVAEFVPKDLVSEISIDDLGRVGFEITHVGNYYMPGALSLKMGNLAIA